MTVSADPITTVAASLDDATLAAAAGSPLRDVTRRFFADRWAAAGLLFLVALAVAAALAPAIVTRVLHQSAFQQHMMERIQIHGRSVDVVSDDGLPVGPAPGFALGADLIGRDVLSRILYGARVSLVVSALGTILAMGLGLLGGLLAGFYRGAVDTMISRFVDAMMAIPVLLLAIALASVLRQGSIAMMVLILALVNWTYLARIVRG